MNREIANLIAEEVSESITRIAQIASGVLIAADQFRPNTEHRTPTRSFRTPNTEHRPGPSEHRTPNTYSVPPNQSALEFLINHTLGMPGAQIEITNTTESASRKLQGAKDRENRTIIKDHSILMVACEQQLTEFLPTAIDRLIELASGITVQYMHKGKTITITHRPNSRSIDYITSRTEGRFASVLQDLREKFENPDLNYPYTAEDFDAMTEAERDALYECALRTSAKAPGTNTIPNTDTDNITSNSPPSPSEERAYGRGAGGEGYRAGGEGYKVGGEGYKAGGEGYKAGGEGYKAGGEGYKAGGEGYKAGGEGYKAGGEGYKAGGEGYKAGGEGYKAGGEGYKAGGEGYKAGGEGYKAGGEGYKAGGEGYKADGAGLQTGDAVQFPSYITTANQRLADFLPKAIGHLKTLARGAQTVITADNQQNCVEHSPDLKANMYLVNRFLGAPPTILKIEHINPKKIAA